MRIPNPLHSRNLVPFKKRRGIYDIPGLGRGKDELSLDQVDHDLSPEEQSFVRHYLGYADTLLNSVPEDYAPPEETPQRSRAPEAPRSKHKDPTRKAA